MEAFTTNQFLVVLLAFALGLFLGMAFLASPKWKRRYRDEARQRQALEAERTQWETERTQWEADRDAHRARDVEPPPRP